jgi:hypothetical protein
MSAHEDFATVDLDNAGALSQNHDQLSERILPHVLISWMTAARVAVAGHIAAPLALIAGRLSAHLYNTLMAAAKRNKTSARTAMPATPPAIGHIQFSTSLWLKILIIVWILELDRLHSPPGFHALVAKLRGVPSFAAQN